MRPEHQHRDRGATAVEYALALGLVVVVVIAALQSVQRGAEQTYETDRAATLEKDLGPVSAPPSTASTVPGPSPTTVPDPEDPEDPAPTSTTSTTAPTTPVLHGSCAGRTCTFWVDLAPAGTSYEWSGPATATGPTFTHEREKNAGSYSVTVRLGTGWTSTMSVVCPNGVEDKNPCTL